MLRVKLYCQNFVILWLQSALFTWKMERLNLIVYTSSCGNYKRTMRPISNLHKAHCIVLHEGLMDLVSLPFKKKPPTKL